MSEKVDNPKNLKPVAKTDDDPLTEAVGIWKKRWPAEVSSVEIVRRIRNGEELDQDKPEQS